MLKAIILICNIAIGACNQDSATDVLKTPVLSANPATCFMEGQAFLAQTELGRSLQPDQIVSIKCVRAEK